MGEPGSQSRVERFEELLPWLNEEERDVDTVRGLLTRFLGLGREGEALHPNQPMVSSLVALKLKTLTGGQVEQLRHRLEIILEQALQHSRGRPFIELRLEFVVMPPWRPAKGPRNARERRIAATSFPILEVGGEVFDVVEYQLLRLLTGPDPFVLGRCPAPAAGAAPRQCGKWLLRSGPRRGRPKEYCSDACRVRKHLRER
jgi:hypothetical protein